MTEALDEFFLARGSGGKRQGFCRLCHNPSEGGVRVQIWKTGGSHNMEAGSSRSKAATFCAEHAIEVYQELESLLREKAAL